MPSERPRVLRGWFSSVLPMPTHPWLPMRAHEKGRPHYRNALRSALLLLCLVFASKPAQHNVHRQRLPNIGRSHALNLLSAGAMATTSAMQLRNQTTTATPGEGNARNKAQSKAIKARQPQRIGRVYFRVFIMLAFETVRPFLELWPKFDVFFDESFVSLQAKLGGLLCKMPVCAFLG